MVVKVFTSWVPTFLTEGMMATEMPEASRPYSIAAAPDWSFRKRRIWFNMGCLGFFCLFCLPPEARFNSKNGMVIKSKLRITMNGKSVTIRAGILVEHDLFGKPVSITGCSPVTGFSGSCSDAEIAVLNIDRAGQVPRVAGPHHAAAFDNGVAVGDAGQRLHVLVDDQDGLA